MAAPRGPGTGPPPFDQTFYNALGTRKPGPPASGETDRGFALDPVILLLAGVANIGGVGDAELIDLTDLDGVFDIARGFRRERPGGEVGPRFDVGYFVQSLYLAKKSGDEDIRDFFEQRKLGGYIGRWYSIIEKLMPMFFQRVEGLPDFGFAADNGGNLKFGALRQIDFSNDLRSQNLHKLYMECTLYNRRVDNKHELHHIRGGDGSDDTMFANVGGTRFSHTQMLASLLGHDKPDSQENIWRDKLALIKEYHPDQEVEEPDWLDDLPAQEERVGFMAAQKERDALEKEIEEALEKELLCLSSLPKMQNCSKWSCPRVAEKLSHCTRCGVRYCSKLHQVEEWRDGHKELCQMRQKVLAQFQSRIDIAGKEQGTGQ